MNPEQLPAHWGVYPTLGHLGGVPIPAYGVFMLLALLAGGAVFAWLARGHEDGRHGLALGLAAFFGGALGAKIPVWALHAREIIAALPDLQPLLTGRTIVGGLVGGIGAVIGTRRYLGIALPSGNLFAPAIALGIAVGRIGCFCAGCCFGTPTGLPWGVDFGDGVPRHPTQLYEAAFALALFVALLALRRRLATPGRLFAAFMIAYFAFRFLVEWLRAGDTVVLGLSTAQLASLGVLAWYLPREIARRTAPSPTMEVHTPPC